jgi:hypothetical protein
MAGRAQGTWLPPVNFQGNYVGCGGNDAEAVYAIHANVIPIGSHRDKVLIWDASKADLCHLVHGFIGDRDQRRDIVSATTTSASLATPVNPTKAPYGHYMLWIVDSAGQVSVAAWVQLL